MKLANIPATIACILFLAGCNQSPSDRGTAGANETTATGQGSGTPSLRRASPAETNSAVADHTTDNNAAKPPDNTGRNVRDRSETAVTPGNQSESKADIDLDSRVRRAVTQNDQLSTTAKNIKIIANGGKVTLRGPVNTAAEKEQIAKTVQGVQGVTSVDDQLEVKNNQ